MTGQDSTVRGVSVVVVDLPPNVPTEQARAAYWQKHLDEVRETLKLDDLPLAIEEGEARTGMPQAFHQARRRLDWTMEALLYDGPRTVLIKKDWREHYDAKQLAAFQALSRQRFKEAVAAFHFLPVGVAPNPEWFYVPGGALAFPPVTGDRDAHEHLVVGFVHKLTGLKIDVTTTFPWDGYDAEKRGLLARLATAAVEWKMNFETVRTGGRTVAGWRGEEVLLRSKGEKNVSFGWAFEPEPNDHGYQPKVVIDVETEDENLDEKLNAWDQFLSAVHSLLPTRAR